MPRFSVPKVGLWVVLSAFAIAACSQITPDDRSYCGPITAQGRQLLAVLDGMNVESLWLAGRHIDWETGMPDKDESYTGPGRSSHCSAFAAAVGKRLGVYMLRPPEHGQVLLANAQAEWFPSDEGKKNGWRSAKDAHEAQSLANAGSLVVVVFKSPNARKPGHIAVVRPELLSQRELEEHGPEITQAGQKNYARTSTKVGFRLHPGAWPAGVAYYAHAVAP